MMSTLGRPHNEPPGDENVPVPNVVPAEQLAGDDDEDTALLRTMLEQATAYIESFPWCDGILKSYFAGGVGKIFAIFLFRISSPNREVDPWEWIVVGDIPPPYLPMADVNSGLAVFEAYIAGMERWIAFARLGVEPGRDDFVPRVNVPATPEWADKLERRLEMLTELVKPHFQ